NRVSTVFLPDALRPNKWTHIAAVSGSTGMRLYVNGELLGTNAYRGNFPASKSGKTNYLGRSNWPAGQPGDDFQGQMDEVRVWKVARAAEEIAANQFTKLTGREPGLIGLWNFNNATNGVAKDLSPARNDGKLAGNARVGLARLPLLTGEAAQLAGKITGADGKPAAGAEVAVFADG